MQGAKIQQSSGGRGEAVDREGLFQRWGQLSSDLIGVHVWNRAIQKEDTASAKVLRQCVEFLGLP